MWCGRETGALVSNETGSARGVDVPCQTGERSRGRSEPALGQVARAAGGKGGRDSSAGASTGAWLGRVKGVEWKGGGQGSRSAAEQWIRYAFVVSRGWEKGRRRPLSTPERPVMANTPSRIRPHHQPSQDRETRMQRGSSESMRSPAQPAAQLRISPADPRIPGTQTAMASRERALCWPPPQHRSTAAPQPVCDGILETQSRMQWRVFGQGVQVHARTHTKLRGKPAMKQPALASVSR